LEAGDEMSVLAELERGPRTLRSVKRSANIERTNPPIYDIGELEFWIAHWDDRKSGVSIVRDLSRRFYRGRSGVRVSGPRYVVTWKNVEQGHW